MHNARSGCDEPPMWAWLAQLRVALTVALLILVLLHLRWAARRVPTHVQRGTGSLVCCLALNPNPGHPMACGSSELRGGVWTAAI